MPLFGLSMRKEAWLLCHVLRTSVANKITACPTPMIQKFRTSFGDAWEIHHRLLLVDYKCSENIQ